MRRSVFFLGIFFSSVALAETVPTVTEPVSSAPVSTQAMPISNLHPKPFDFSGYIDGSYNYLSRSNHFTSGVHDRVFDLAPNGFTLQQAAITVARQPKQGLGGLFNALIGRDANTLAPYGMYPYFGIQNIGYTITQVFLQYAFKSFTLMGGKFNVIAGAENYNPTLDTNFSRSILDGYAEPATVLGFRGTYVVNDAVSLVAGINNGWDNIRDTSRRKTIELGVAYTPNSKFSFSIQDYNGQQRATDGVSIGPTGIRNLVDLVSTWNASEKLNFVINYDYGNQNRATLAGGNLGEAIWQGMAGYANYKINDRWRTSLRAEIFSDHNGYRTGVQQTWKEATLTLGYAPIKNIEFRAETRRDFSSVNSFVDKNGVGVGNNLQSFALEVLYQF